MIYKQIQRCLIGVIIWGFVHLVIAQDNINQQHLSIVKETQQNQVQRQQYQLEQQFKNQIQYELSEWIVQQIKHNQQYPQVLAYQSAKFLLQPNTPHIYRIPISIKQEILIQISLYQLSSQGLLLLPQSPDEQNFVQVLTFDSPHQHQYHNNCRVYIQKIIPLKFRTEHKYIKLTNKGVNSLVVKVDIEYQEILMEIVVSDDQFELIRKKMEMILQEMKQSEVMREHVYKWQWGFYEKLWRHQSDMLGFTGAELLVIIVTSIVQMYCIKNLINNQFII